MEHFICCFSFVFTVILFLALVHHHRCICTRRDKRGVGAVELIAAKVNLTLRRRIRRRAEALQRVRDWSCEVRAADVEVAVRWSDAIRRERRALEVCTGDVEARELRGTAERLGQRAVEPATSTDRERLQVESKQFGHSARDVRVDERDIREVVDGEHGDREGARDGPRESEGLQGGERRFREARRERAVDAVHRKGLERRRGCTHVRDVVRHHTGAHLEVLQFVEAGDVRETARQVREVQVEVLHLRGGLEGARDGARYTGEVQIQLGDCVEDEVWKRSRDPGRVCDEQLQVRQGREEVVGESADDLSLVEVDANDARPVVVAQHFRVRARGVARYPCAVRPARAVRVVVEAPQSVVLRDGDVSKGNAGETHKHGKAKCDREGLLRHCFEDVFDDEVNKVQKL
eukprot:PhM_4_TR9835/c0_g1_i2/m.18107